ncbi:hypothetical protein AVEN_35658-1 [Araneus ventricosus]|uniref:Uncharacterized protein n=1 Tax=Araneus ventricosus TaxID=182803 RepID=A0A4Y2GAQ7_ARAVE|nr:hypothetical protein AVEN_35658-1 [Araneus ventricosus]
MHLTYGDADCMDTYGAAGKPLCVYTRIVSRKHTNDDRQHRNATFGKHWICSGSPVQWHAISPNLSCLVFFFCGQIKALVYDTPVDSVSLAYQ